MSSLSILMKQRTQRTSTFLGSDRSTFMSGTSSHRATVLASPSLSSASETLEDWMYWQRDASNAHCWTKVYSVLDNEFLWLFKGNHSSKTLFLQIAVSSVEVSGQRQLRVVDPNGEDMELWLLDEDSFSMWRQRLEEAAALTTQFFRITEIEARRLPRKSAYRGSLVTYRRASKQARFKAVIEWVMQWRRKCVELARLSLTAIPSRRQKLQQHTSLRSTCSKTTSSMRSTFCSLSMLSSLSTSVSSDSLSTATSSYGGLMEDYDDLDEEIEDEDERRERG
ncbi:unnamed protein product [Peronospora destructor]|uniref:PH domain-containing protein n=1 Tax=Peronospora destructor TaxID=86335 RepID=A0AAV0VC64_9STRA|nr:unnamed protein product [Peronospora destructor]